MELKRGRKLLGMLGTATILGRRGVEMRYRAGVELASRRGC